MSPCEHCGSTAHPTRLHREPSLSSAVKSMLHDEQWAAIQSQERAIMALNARCREVEQRVATLEQVTAGPPEGPGFGQLEQHVAALEELCAGCKEANELIESMPLPREELD